MEHITSRHNPLMGHIRKLVGSAAYRRATGEFLCDSPKLLQEALLWQAEITAVVSTSPLPRLPEHIRQVQVPEDVMASISPVKTPQGVLFTCRLPQAPLPQTLTGRRYVLLDGVQDPGNVGTLLRSAAAFGFDAVVLGPGCASPLSPKTLRSSMGAAGRLPTLHSDDLPAALAALRARGVTTLATALYRSRPLDEAGNDFPGGLCVVIGSEGQGLTDRTVEACDMAVRIPMTDRVESLNAAVAGSVLLWHFRGV